MAQDTTANWLKFLNPESLKQSLLRASIYITCWEMLREAVIGHPKDFFTHEWSADGEGVPGPNYAAKVLSLDRDPLIASALWFRNQGAITDDDIQALKTLRRHRNEIAHELPKFLGQVESEVRLDFLNGTFHLVEKIDKWWIQNVEIPTNSDFDDKTLTDHELNTVASARMIYMDLIISVANGDEDRLRKIYEGFKLQVEQIKTHKPQSSRPSSSTGTVPPP